MYRAVSDHRPARCRPINARLRFLSIIAALVTEFHRFQVELPSALGCSLPKPCNIQQISLCCTLFIVHLILMCPHEVMHAPYFTMVINGALKAYLSENCRQCTHHIGGVVSSAAGYIHRLRNTFQKSYQARPRAPQQQWTTRGTLLSLGAHVQRRPPRRQLPSSPWRRTGHPWLQSGYPGTNPR